MTCSGALTMTSSSSSSSSIIESSAHLLRSPSGVAQIPDVLYFNWGLHNVNNETVPGQSGPISAYAPYLEKIVGRLSFFVNSGMKLITETAKMIAFTELWDEICKKRFKVKEEKYRRFRYGMQVNSLGLTELQPENNVYRISTKNCYR